MGEFRGIGERVQLARERARLSQAELAARVGLSRTRVAQIEGGQNTTLLTLRRLASELGVTETEILAGRREPELTPEALLALWRQIQAHAEPETRKILTGIWRALASDTRFKLAEAVGG